jgi:intracellular sulfur oxidation DsrE/DsrF family protein
MRKVFLWAAALTVGGLMLHGAFACELNRQASQPNWAIVLPGACSGSNCLVDPPQDPLTSNPVQDCGAAYFDPGTYSGNNGLLEWLMASLVIQSPYKPGAGFASLALILASDTLAADAKGQPLETQHRLLIQVNQNDPALMNLALNNATNVIEYYRAKGEDVAVDIVTYGPGLNMLRADASPVQDRVKQLKSVAFPSTVQFSACNVTRQGMEKKEGRAIEILSEASVVPSGVVHLMELQEKGWSYIRP